jgi:hypothetical protein
MVMTHGKWLRMALMALGLTGLPQPGLAQTDTGAISGTVTDPSGAAVSGAEVAATHVETNFTRSARTAADGSYRITALPLGTYRLDVNAGGFRTYTRKAISLELGRTARVDPQLQIGAVTEAVEITGDAPLVELSNPGLGLVVGNREVLNLPIINRRVYSLLSLVPGVEMNDFEPAGTFGFTEQNVTITGSARAGIGSVNFLVDGGSNVSGLRGSANPPPNPDAVQEFKVTTNNFSAEFGRFQGGVVEIATKSGTNSFHGSLFEYFRDETFNAREWTPNPIAGQEKPPLDRHDFGFTAGGPIKKDRTFFFLSYAGLRQKQTATRDTAVVPTALERAGDYSQSRLKPTDPLTGQRFPSDTIPQNRMDPVALLIQNGDPGRSFPQWVPLPQSGRTTFLAEQEEPTTANEALVKIEQNLGNKQQHRLFASYFYRGSQFDEGLFGNLPYTVRLMTGKQHNLVLGHTWSLGATTINQLRANYVWSYGGRNHTPDISIADYGSTYPFQPVGPEDKYNTLPQIRIDNFFTLQGAIDGPDAGSTFYQVRDTLSWFKGRHAIKLGGEAYLEKFTHNTSLNNYGIFRFDGAKTGNAYADFQLGLLREFKQDSPVQKLDDSWFFGLFVQDDIKLTSRLTANVGLRWDLQLPMTDPNDRQLTYVRNAQSTQVPFVINGGRQVVVPHLLFPGDRLDANLANADGIDDPPSEIPRGIVNTDWNNFAPRIGLAWDVTGDGKTALRAGFGKYFGGISGNEWNGSADNQPFTIRQDFRATAPAATCAANPRAAGCVGTLANPQHPGGNPFPYSYTPGAIPTVYLPMSTLGPDLTFEWPYTYQVNVSLQREVFEGISLGISYVGAFSRKLPIDIDANYPRPDVPGITAAANNIDQRRPLLPGTLGRVRTIFSALGSDYNGFQATAEKRGTVLAVRASYVYGRSWEDALLDDESRAEIQSQLDVFQGLREGKKPSEIPALAAERAISGSDRAHRFNASLIWQVDYVKNANRFVRALANGWTVSAIVHLRSGRPFGIGVQAADRNLDGISNERATIVPGIDPNKPNGRSRGELSRAELIREYFETSAFVTPPLGSGGDSRRNILRGPGDRNVDMGIFRTVGLGGERKLQLRAEINNVFNIVNLDNPNSTVGSNQYGMISGAAGMREVQFGARFSF